MSKFAVTFLSLSIVRMQVEPLHAPDQPVNVESEDGIAVKVT